MKQVGADSQNTLHARAHQGRGDDEAAARADAAADQTGTEANQNGSAENEMGVVGWSKRGLAAQKGGELALEDNQH